MLEDKTKDKTKDTTNCMGVVYVENKTRDMTDRIGVIYVRRQNERTRRIILASSTSKKNKRHDESYRCRLCSKTKQKNGADHMSVVYAKIRQVENKEKKAAQCSTRLKA